ncbi:MAG: nickel ABC transporter permease [Pseudomonadota bacterium]
MKWFLAKRAGALIPVLIGVSIAVFLMLHLVPGDPARIIAGQEASAQDVETVRNSLGLDRPLPTQYADFVGRYVRGDLGTSYRTKRPVSGEVAAGYGNTMILGVAGMVFAIALGVPLGIASAVWKFSWVDNLCLAISLLGVSMPTFFLGLLLMLVMSVQLGWLPLAGADTPLHLVLPAITLGLPTAAVIARITRSSMIDVLGSDYVRTARAKGAKDSSVVWRHAFRNALIPVTTVIGLQMGYMLGGAVIVETVFAWPGLGRLTVQAISARDFPVVQAAVLVLAVTFVAVNMITDILYGFLDPRISAS